MIGGPPPVAKAFSRVPKAVQFNPRAAADPAQYLRKSRLDTFTTDSFTRFSPINGTWKISSGVQHYEQQLLLKMHVGRLLEG
jgi:hypothetical protein